MRHSGPLILLLLLLVTPTTLAADAPLSDTEAPSFMSWVEELSTTISNVWKSMTSSESRTDRGSGSYGTTGGAYGAGGGTYETTENTNQMGSGHGGLDDDFGGYSDPSGGREP